MKIDRNNASGVSVVSTGWSSIVLYVFSASS